MAGAASPTAMAAAAATDPPRQVAHGHSPTDLLAEARASTAGPYLDTVQIRTRLKTGPARALTRRRLRREGTAVAAALIGNGSSSAATHTF